MVAVVMSEGWGDNCSAGLYQASSAVGVPATRCGMSWWEGRECRHPRPTCLVPRSGTTPKAGGFLLSQDAESLLCLSTEGRAGAGISVGVISLLWGLWTTSGDICAYYNWQVAPGMRGGPEWGCSTHHSARKDTAPLARNDQPPHQ